MTARATSVGILIPAFNEESTVADVVKVALEAGLGEVLVVADGCSDATAQVAKAAGARVLEYQPNRGKGGAVAAGVASMSQETLVLLDADLINLTPQHVLAMLEPLHKNEADTTVGLFSGGGGITDFGNRATPQWSGQRAIPRALLARVPALADRNYAIELAITDQIQLEGLRCKFVNLEGVSQRLKEQKLGLVRGLLRRLKMYWQILKYAVLERKRHTQTRS
jgi:glycosyltransferase involved in cell wall biosynthesis